MSARHFIGDEPFAVLLGDDIMISENRPCSSSSTYIKNIKHLSSAFSVSNLLMSPNTGSFRQPRRKIKYMTSKTWSKNLAVREAPSNIAVMGRYILEPSIFPVLERTQKGAGNEIQLTDALRDICREQNIYARQLEGSRFDIGDKLGCFKASIEMGLMRDEMRPKLLAYMENVLKRETQKGALQ
ncbi:hypothetical protein QKW52_00385 [Bacillus sonorensis]|nr:hypothetical protein [Bacillus sonorensis]